MRSRRVQPVALVAIAVLATLAIERSMLQMSSETTTGDCSNEEYVSTEDSALKRKALQATIHWHESIARERAAEGVYQNVTVFRDTHPAFQPLDPQYQPRHAWRDTTIPDLNIVGLGKTGTSQLYQILTSHEATVPFSDKAKEYCMSRRSPQKNAFQGWTHSATAERRKVVQEWMFEFYRQEYNRQKKNAGNVTVNGW